MLTHHTPCDAVRRTLSLSYGRFFAEFLEELSLVRLGLLDLPTCVGLGYGFLYSNLRSFSWKRAPRDSFGSRRRSRYASEYMQSGFA